MTMTAAEPPTAAALRSRLDNGAPMLFAMEMGDVPKGPEYDTWLHAFEDILADYEAAVEREERTGAKP